MTAVSPSLDVCPASARRWRDRFETESAIDGRAERQAGDALSQAVRTRIEEVFGWSVGAAGLRQTRHRRPDRVGWASTLADTACNLVTLPTLLRPAA